MDRNTDLGKFVTKEVQGAAALGGSLIGAFASSLDSSYAGMATVLGGAALGSGVLASVKINPLRYDIHNSIVTTAAFLNMAPYIVAAYEVVNRAF